MSNGEIDRLSVNQSVLEKRVTQSKPVSSSASPPDNCDGWGPVLTSLVFAVSGSGIANAAYSIVDDQEGVPKGG